MDTELQLRAMVDMDMSCQMRILVLVDLDYSIEKILDSITCPADRRDNRHTEKVTELFDIKLITLSHKLVVHIQSHDHAQIHIDDLCGKIEITLEIRGIYDIDDNVRNLLHEMTSHIQFLGAVGRK